MEVTDNFDRDGIAWIESDPLTAEEIVPHMLPLMYPISSGADYLDLVRGGTSGLYLLSL
jgi:hypothetical protein